MSRVFGGFRRLRWALDPNRWMIRWLKLSEFQEAENKRGLILIQIDGLSHPHFQRAMDKGRMPFLKSLCQKEHYQDWHHYSGIPSCTPSIQAELFYGIKQCVPAFKFQDYKSGKIFNFYNSHVGCEIESRLQEKNEGLLQGGSSYSNIFRGGAGENAHFCVASMGWNAFFKALNPLTFAILIGFNFLTVLQVIYLLVLEISLAIFDSIRGAFLGFGFGEEIKFILSRLIVTIGLRELSTLGAKLDMARGLRVIHVNFFGYDDQAHRRGPSSAFAYWSLPGIDGCVKRIWKAAQNSISRDYEVWIYSDHGQQEVIPYAVENGGSVEKAIAELFHLKFPNQSFDFKKGVTAQGPIGFIYFDRELSSFEKEAIAHELVHEIHIPLVILQNSGTVYAFTEQGCFPLPDKAAAILGDDHPYLDEVTKELVSLCQNPSAGAFVISGWRREKRSVSFPHEYGSHAGPGPEETDGFALLPKDIHVPSHNKKYLRPMILRETALAYLKGEKRIFYEGNSLRPARQSLRIMTYNVHSCVGMDGKLSLDRIARVIARHDPDIVALQELDSGRLRTLGFDQMDALAKRLDMQHHFHPVLTVEEEMYGNGILSRYPFKIVRAGSLPRLWGHSYFEPRGALWIEIQYLDTKIQLINTHLSFWSHEQRKQIEALCGPEWLSHANCNGNVIVCGDFNALPYSGTCRSMKGKLEDVQLRLDSHKPLKTWFGHFPMGRIDHIFSSKNIEVLKVEVPNTCLEKLASDHLPLIAELRIPHK